MRKFTGGSGDDDDKTDEQDQDDLAWKKFFLKPLEEAAGFVSCEKANGEVSCTARRYADLLLGRSLVRANDQWRVCSLPRKQKRPYCDSKSG